MRLKMSLGLAATAMVLMPQSSNIALAQNSPATSEIPLPAITAPFDIHIVASNIASGYQVVAADVNKDGRTDLIGLGLKAEDLTWFENPGWIPHVITTTKTTPEMVIMDAADLDGDGIPEIALAYGFNANPTLSVGNVGILHSDGDPRRPWKVRDIDHVPATHRLAFADVKGDGKNELIGAPILADKATGFPDPEHLSTPLYLYQPSDGARSLISDQSRGVVHGLFKYDWYGEGRENPITAGYGGVVVHRLDKDGKWAREQIAPGDPAEWPNGGVGDVVVGKMAGKQFFVTIEPFHGNMVVVYTQDAQGKYQRKIIDTELQTGHALTLVDVDSDGVPEIVAGGNRSKTSLFFYKAADAKGRKWTKTLMDNDMAAVSCIAADIDSDGSKNDVACMDARAPNSLKWYKYTG